MGKTGHFTFSGAEAAAVTIDGDPVASLPHEGKVYDALPGKHEIAAKSSANTQTVSVDLAAGTSREVKFEMGAGAAPIDFQAIAPKPATGPVQNPETPPPDTSQSAAASSLSPARVGVAAGLGAIGIGLGVAGAFELKAASDHGATTRSLSAQNPYCALGQSSGCGQLHDSAQAHVNDQNLGVAFLVSGGVALAAGVTTWFLWPHQDRSKGAVTVTPWFGHGQAGFGAFGTF